MFSNTATAQKEIVTAAATLSQSSQYQQGGGDKSTTTESSLQKLGNIGDKMYGGRNDMSQVDKTLEAARMINLHNLGK